MRDNGNPEVISSESLASEVRNNFNPEVNQETVNSVQESEFPTEESKRWFIGESSKIDDDKILNQDEKLKEEVVKLFLENFSMLALHPNHCGKQISRSCG